MRWEDLGEGKTIGAALDQAVRRFGDKEAMVFPDCRLTLGAIQQAAARTAKAFLALGVRRGDRVAVWMAGYKEWAFAYYGLARLGAVLVPVNTRYKPPEIEYVLRKAGAGVLLFRDETVHGKEYAAMLLPLIPELSRCAPGGLRSQRFPGLRWVIAAGDRARPGMLAFDEFLELADAVTGGELARAEAEVRAEDTFLIQFTSGTTAFPKGAMLFHSAMLRGCYSCAAPFAIAPSDRLFSPQPFYHAGGSVLVMLLPVITGATIVVQPYFEPGGALQAMEAGACSITLGHQPHWVEYLNHPELPGRALKLTRAMIFPGQPEMIRRIQAAMGIGCVASPYGLTESHLAGACPSLDDPPEKLLHTVGRPTPGHEIQIRDPQSGRVLGPGDPGEICLRGWGVMKGYYDDPERTREALDPEGWLRTGDLGVLDAEGYLSIIGRLKEMIRVGGENVAAAEIEACLLRHPKVKQAVVVSAPDARLGEVPVAWVELRTGEVAEEEELRRFCGRELAGFKVPRAVLFTREWPMSGTGKIQRFILKEAAVKARSA